MKRAVNRGFSKVFFREVAYIFEHKITLFICVFGPLLSLIIAYGIFSKPVPRDLPVAFVDSDKTQISRSIRRMIQATSVAEIQENYIDMNQAKNAIEKGDVFAIIYVPNGTERNILLGVNTDVAVYLNNTNLLTSGLMNSSIRKVLATVSAAVKIKYYNSKGKTWQQSVETSMPIQLQSKILFNPYLNYSYFLASALMPLLLMVFTMLSTGYGLGRELYYGTGKACIEHANNNVMSAIFGKILPYTLVSFCLAMIMNIFLFKFLQMPMRGSFGIIVLSEILLIVSYQAVIVFLITLFKNLRLILSLASAYIMMALTFSGLTFPIQAMPIVAKVFSQCFPFTFWLQCFLGQTLRAEPTYISLQTLLSLFVFIMLGVLSLPRLQYILQTPKYWGRE